MSASATLQAAAPRARNYALAAPPGVTRRHFVMEDLAPRATKRARRAEDALPGLPALVSELAEWVPARAPAVT